MFGKSSLALTVLLGLALASFAEQTILASKYDEYPYYRFDNTVKRVAIIGAGAFCSVLIDVELRGHA